MWGLCHEGNRWGRSSLLLLKVPVPPGQTCKHAAMGAELSHADSAGYGPGSLVPYIAW